ncbi:unnamed protein product [Rotaria sp. Silwood2]|nr:unnamed protein product [Rotaria sp. Silwood2]CAF4031780.1 unnamed protein product [Rotaria sp. Silwood2]
MQRILYHDIRTFTYTNTRLIEEIIAKSSYICPDIPEGSLLTGYFIQTCNILTPIGVENGYVNVNICRLFTTNDLLDENSQLIEINSKISADQSLKLE